MTRTHKKNWRIYADGYDMSGYGFGIGPLAWTAQPAGETPVGDAVHGFLPGVNTVSIGTLNTVLDNTASVSSHAVLSTIGGSRTVSVAVGGTSAPVSGDPVFAGEFSQLSYNAVGDAMVTTSIEFGDDSIATTLLYARPWGRAIHVKGAETAANTGTSDHDHGAQTALGGVMQYHIFSGDGTATISIDDAATDSDLSYSSLVSAGELDCSSVQHGTVALGTTATVERYSRWQLALNTATTVTFFISFHRAI